MKDKILLAGSSGYVGSCIKRSIEEKFDLIETQREKTGLNIIQLNEKQCQKIDESTKVLIISLGSTELHSDSYIKSVESSINTIACLIDRHKKDIPKAKIIYISTFQVYGEYEGLISEETLASPKNTYAVVHYMTELLLNQYCTKNDVQLCILRPTNIYGTNDTCFPFRRKTLVPNCFINEAFKSKIITIKSQDRVFRDFINVKDLTEIVEKIIRDLIGSQPIPLIINICSGKTLEILEIAKKTQRVFNKLMQQDIEVVTPNMKKEILEKDFKSSLSVKSTYLDSLKWECSNSKDVERELINLIQIYNYNRKD